MTGWRLYYSDGTTFSSDDGTWEQAPDEDVQVLVVYEEHPNKVLTDGHDEYRLPGETAVKRGAWMDEAGFYAVQRRALESSAEEA